MALRRMRSSDLLFHIEKLHNAFEKLNAIRNQFEHMHMQIVHGQAGKGPISITFASEGSSVKFRDKRLETTELRDLLQAAFLQVTCLYPSFDSSSAPEQGGPIKLTITSSIEVIEGRPKQRDANT